MTARPPAGLPGPPSPIVLPGVSDLVSHHLANAEAQERQRQQAALEAASQVFTIAAKGKVLLVRLKNDANSRAGEDSITSFYTPVLGIHRTGLLVFERGGFVRSSATFVDLPEPVPHATDWPIIAFDKAELESVESHDLEPWMALRSATLPAFVRFWKTGGWADEDSVEEATRAFFEAEDQSGKTSDDASSAAGGPPPDSTSA